MVIWSMFWMRMEMLLDKKSRMMKPINGLLVKPNRTSEMTIPFPNRLESLKNMPPSNKALPVIFHSKSPVDDLTKA